MLAAAATLCACTRVGADNAPATGTTESRGHHAWTQPGVLRVAFQDSPNSLQPLLSGNTSEVFLNRLTFDPLVTTSPDGKQVPRLAAEVPTLENGGISKDGLTITYHLRRNVKWHDGVPFTSQDVKFSFNAVMNPANNVSSRVGYDDVARVDVPDAYTVVFHLKRKYAPFVDTVFGDSDSPYEIVPAHLLAKSPDINHLAFNTQPVGTGPFKFAKWVRGDHLEYVPNDDYYLGKPKLRSIIVRFIPDENTEVNALRTHDVDWMFEASPSLYKVLKTMPDVHNVLGNMNNWEGMSIESAHPPLNDPHVRQAIAYAINTPDLLQKFTFGSASPAIEDIPPWLWAHDPNVKNYPYAPDKAKALLAQAGWTPGRDGILTKNGKRLSLVIVYNVANATRRGLSVQVQSMLKAVGIDAQIKAYPISLYAAPIGMGGIVQSGKYDLALRGWISGADPDNHALFDCNAVPPAGNNDMRFCDPRIDAAERIALEHYDRPSRKAAYATVESILSRQVPAMYFFHPHLIQALNPDLKGVEPNLVTEAWNAYQWEM